MIRLLENYDDLFLNDNKNCMTNNAMDIKNKYDMIKYCDINKLKKKHNIKQYNYGV